MLLALIYIGTNLGHDVRPTAFTVPDDAPRDWQHYGATQAGTRYAPSTAISRDNVDQLERAWEATTGIGGAFKGTPVQVDNGLYLCTAGNVVLALDADNGRERWRFDPEINAPRIGFWDTCRGVTYVDLRERAIAATEGATCDERIVVATTDARMIALDRTTGAMCPSFGTDGVVDLLDRMGEVKPGFYFTTSPATVAGESLVLGGWVLDNFETGEPSGVVRGFDVETGELRWAWDIGRPDGSLPEPGESFTRGTPNVWSLTSADDELGLVYVPTGNATPDYFGGHRTEAMEEYASSIVAIDATSGQSRWHFQTTHHDIWDYDVPSQPTLVDVPIDGTLRRAVIVPTKRAELFFLDRETGEPLAAIEERAVPPTTLPEEWTSPTQPFSTGMPSFAHPTLTTGDIWGITPFDHMACLQQFADIDYEGPFTPSSTNGTLIYPGIAGGMNWGSVAVDEANHLMVVNALHMPFTTRSIPREEADAMEYGFGLGGPQKGTPYGAQTAPFFSPLFAPCLRPPYGEMGVVDLKTQELVWRRPLGTASDVGPLGLSLGIPLPMGMFYQAGSLVTGGGLIFNGGVLDATLRAIDIETGAVLWSDDLATPSEATPMSYTSPATGRQYVILALPGDGNFDINAERRMDADGAEASDAAGGRLIAYALPDA